MRLVPLFLLFTSVLRAEEIACVKMNLGLTYKDASHSCSNLATDGLVYFSAEVDGEKIVRAKFYNFPYEFPFMFIYKSIDLKEEDTRNIRLYRDAKDRLWLKELPLTAVRISWILYYSMERDIFCKVPTYAKEIAPNPALFHFETEGIDDGILISRSEQIELKGKLIDTTPYAAKVKIVQGECK